MKRLHALTVAFVLLACLAGIASAQTRAHGIDVSHWQGNMNWQTAYDAKNVRFAFVRASRGGTSTGAWSAGFENDTQYGSNVTKLRNLAVVNGKTIYSGFYHYARPDLIAQPNTNDNTSQQPALSTIIASAQDEANHFWSVIDQDMSTIGIDAGRRLRPVLDLEERGGGDDGPDPDTFPDTDALTPTNLSRWVDEFLNRFESLSGGIRPLLYMNTNYASNFITSSLSDEQVWIANWGTPTQSQTGNPPDGIFPQWEFWQYDSPNGLGSQYGAQSFDIDLNVAHGDLNFVRTFLIPEPGGATVALLLSLVHLGSRRRRQR